MQQQADWKAEFEQYARQGEPSRARRSEAWQTAIGLQDVDGLTPSDYLIDTAKDHIEGTIDMPAARQRIEKYYEQREGHDVADDGTMEADIVSVRIAELLGEDTFQFSPVELRRIHKRLFDGVFGHAGVARSYNITKKEWVLSGDTVIYAPFDSIQEALDYDFAQEKGYDYSQASALEAVAHIAQFTSGIWQIHPFSEGNTRSVAVFVIKYLRSFGFEASNDVFADSSWYFRNALVRANYNDLKRGIHSTAAFLEHFFENLLLGSHYKLKNRFLHIDAPMAAEGDSLPESRKASAACTVEELRVLRAMADNPQITQRALAEIIGKSERTVKAMTVALQERGCITRVNGRRNGHWKLSRECLAD